MFTFALITYSGHNISDLLTTDIFRPLTIYYHTLISLQGIPIPHYLITNTLISSCLPPPIASTRYISYVRLMPITPHTAA